jgi:hypothetical protein
MPLQDYVKLRSNLRATWLAAPERASPALLNPRGGGRRAAAAVAALVAALASSGSPGSATPYYVDFDRDVLHYRIEDGMSSVVLPDCVVPYFAALAGVTAWAVHSRWAPWEAADLFATEFLSRHRLLVGTSKQTVHDILHSACEGSLGRLIELVVVERERARDSLTSVGLDGPALLAAWHPASFVDVLDPSGRMTTRTGLGDDAPSLFALVPKDVWIRVLEVHCADSVREYVFRDGTLSPDERSVQASLSCFRSAPREQSAATTPLQLCAGDCGGGGRGLRGSRGPRPGAVADEHADAVGADRVLEGGEGYMDGVDDDVGVVAAAEPRAPRGTAPASVLPPPSPSTSRRAALRRPTWPAASASPTPHTYVPGSTTPAKSLSSPTRRTGAR